MLIILKKKQSINYLYLSLYLTYPWFLTTLLIVYEFLGFSSFPLAVVGFVTPLFLAIVGFANGLSAGSNSLIARYIGAEDYPNTENNKIHSIRLSIIITIIITLIIIVILKLLHLIMDAGEIIS